MFRHLSSACLLLGLLSCGIVHSQDSQEKMPREDVVQIPAIGKGLCVSNIFQTNMVLQRDKPLNIWGGPSRARRSLSRLRASILEETPGKITTPENMPEDAARRYAGNQIRKKLELADTERRIQEAEATIAELKPVLEKANADSQKKK